MIRRVWVGCAFTLALALGAGCKKKSNVTVVAKNGGNTTTSQGSVQTPPESKLTVELPVQPHWQPRRSPAFDTVYMGDPGDVYYTRRVQGVALPDLDDIEAVRQHFRETTREEDGGILSVEVTQVQERQAIVYYSKQVVNGIRGYRYIARCVIPTDNEWLEVRMDAIEMGPTGGRETVATLSLGTNLESEPIPPNAAKTPAPGGSSKPGDTRIKGFFFDPYDEKYNDGAINSIADDTKYDTALPNHPLSRIRRLFPHVLKDMTLE